MMSHDMSFAESAHDIFHMVSKAGHIHSVTSLESRDLDIWSSLSSITYVGEESYGIVGPCLNEDCETIQDKRRDLRMLVADHPHAQDGISYFYDELNAPDRIQFYIAPEYVDDDMYTDHDYLEGRREQLDDLTESECRQLGVEYRQFMAEQARTEHQEVVAAQ